MNARRLLAALLLAAAPLASHAYTPENGWYGVITSDNNPPAAGMGLNIEIQNEFLFGAGYIWGQNGLPIWVLMQGKLIHQSDGTWTLNDPNALITGQNGQCLGNATTCPYKKPSVVPIGGVNLKLAENIGTITWGIAGNQATATLMRFDFQLGGGPGSLNGRWDVLIEHQGAANGDAIQYEGDRLRINDVHTNADGSIAVNGCVENSLSPPTQTCDTSGNSFAVKGSAPKSAVFGHTYQIAAYTFSLNGSTPKIMRVYTFAENGLGGAFANTIRGTVNLCGSAGVDSVAQCTAVKNVAFVAHRSASGHYAQTGAGMDDRGGD